MFLPVPADAEALKNLIKAPYVHCYYSNLGGAKNASLMLIVSLDSKETWTNNIMQNSRYLMFQIDSKIELFSKSHQITAKFRKTSADNLEQIAKKINSFIETVGTITDMPKTPAAPYKPDVAILPGVTIRRYYEAKGMTQAELAERMAYPLNKLNELIQGKTAISVETARKLELVLGYPATFWLNLEQNYQLTKARLAAESRLQEQAKGGK